MTLARRRKRRLSVYRPASFATLLSTAAIRFGQYAREANSLALVSRSGALTIKMTRRTATFKASEAASGPPPEQDIPLAVPKKTRLYVEQTQREREQALEMHRIFQRDLCKLRLTAARAYVKTISDGGSALATLTGASLRLNATVSGLGPNFKITIDVSVRAAASHLAAASTLTFSQRDSAKGAALRFAGSVRRWPINSRASAQ